MSDRIHQSYRLKHIPAGMAAYKAAAQFGAAALSGAGPSIICFVPRENAEPAKEKIIDVFAKQGIEARGVITTPSTLGTHKVYGDILISTYTFTNSGTQWSVVYVISLSYPHQSIFIIIYLLTFVHIIIFTSYNM